MLKLISLILALIIASTYLQSQTTTFMDIYIVNDEYPIIMGDKGAIVIGYNNEYSIRYNSELEFFYPSDAFFFNDVNGFVVGIQTRPTERKIIETNDSGRSWSTVLTNLAYDVRAITFNNRNEGWAGLVNGSLYKTIDGGNTWQEKGAVEDVYDIQFANEEIGFLVGKHSIYKTINSGETWSEVFRRGDLNFHDLQVIDQTMIVASFSSGIIKSTDGGSNWTLFVIDGDGLIESVKFFDNEKGVAVGGKNGRDVIYTTNDGGNNWALNDASNNTSGVLNKVATTTTGMAWVIGDNETILSSSDFGINWNSVSIIPVNTYPEENESFNFNLINNYPNPFNPSTNISYKLERAGNISLDLYDITGRLITNIDEGYRSQGEYTINFSANGLSSGIYIYTLTTTEGAISNKMTIIK